MSNKGQNIIEKIVKRDFNNDLEEVLASKSYEEDVKNLLLDILYKIDNSYKDYKKVKVDSLSKDDYIVNIIKTIKNKCENIKIIKPKINEDEPEKKVAVNKQKKEIISYPILNKILYGISDIRKSEDIVKDEDKLISKTLTNMITIGNNINTVEPLRDFNGFSWNIISKDIENIYYNLIYQNLIILNGNKFFELWANKNKIVANYMEVLENDLSKQYGIKEAKDIIELLKRLSVLIEISSNSHIIKQIYDEKLALEEELKKFEDSQGYIVEIANKRKTLLKKLKRIDITLNNKELLEKEYKRRNDLLDVKNKIFSEKVLAKKIAEERNQIMDKLKKYNDLMNPKNINIEKNKLNKKLRYRKLVEVNNLEEEIYNYIILLQKMTLKCLRNKIKKCTDKNELLNIMNQVRYLSFVPIKVKQNIGETKELIKSLNIIKKEIYQKANDLKMINIILENEKLNLAIFNHIFATKIISLEDISYKIAKTKQEWYVQFFDEGITDETFKIELDLKTGDTKIKLNKKVKLFNN